VTARLPARALLPVAYAIPAEEHARANR
jgi:hypothetical protein